MSGKKMFYSPNTFQSYGDAEIAAVEQFLREHPFDDASAVKRFEDQVAGIFKMKHGIFVNSGSSANFLACLALGIGPNDEVITPACTFPTTLSPLVFLHAKVTFCDVAEARYVPSVDQVMALVKPSTTVILIPDIVGDKFDFVGLKARLREIGRSDIRTIEDACDTVTESVSDLATISFYASHIINSGGCGGMVLTSDEALARKCYELRDSGAWDLTAPAYCAVFGYVNALKVNEFAEARLRNYKHYCARLKDCDFYTLPAVDSAVWLSMPLICASNRFEIVEELEKRQIQTRLCLAGNILRQPFYARLYPDVDPEAFPNTERVFEGAMLIGLHQGITPDDVDWICDQLLELAVKFAKSK